MSPRYFDADGHIMEKQAELVEFIEPPYQADLLRSRQLLPSLDHFHTPRQGAPDGRFDRGVGPERWREFLERTGIEASVLYPTDGLSYGNVAFAEWATAYARAYNNWLHEKYLQVDPRFKGIALLPLQDVPSAVAELRRAVTELGMVGAMLPSNGLTLHLSHPYYWPVYEEAERLGCALAVHGGSYIDLGFNTFTVFPATRVLGMPFPLAIAMTGMIVDGMLDAFPRLRVGFLEGGTAWIPLVIDRLERETEYGDLELKRKPLEYFTDGRVFVSCEGNEKALAYSIERIGPEPFVFASDFPHEITLDNCMKEIEEIEERDDIQDAHKAMILGGNARRFYDIQ